MSSGTIRRRNWKSTCQSKEFYSNCRWSSQLNQLNKPFPLLILSEETNQNDIPDVSPFKTKLDAIRVQKQTPRPISPSNEGVTVRPFGPSAPPAPVISSAPVSPYNLLQGQADPHGNPFGSPGPFVGANYLPPNDYLPPGNAPPPARAISSGHGDYLAPPSDYENQITAAAASASASVFKYV